MIDAGVLQRVRYDRACDAAEVDRRAVETLAVDGDRVMRNAGPTEGLTSVTVGAAT